MHKRATFQLSIMLLFSYFSENIFSLFFALYFVNVVTLRKNCDNFFLKMSNFIFPCGKHVFQYFFKYFPYMFPQCFCNASTVFTTSFVLSFNGCNCPNFKEKLNLITLYQNWRIQSSYRHLNEFNPLTDTIEIRKKKSSKNLRALVNFWARNMNVKSILKVLPPFFCQVRKAEAPRPSSNSVPYQ